MTTFTLPLILTVFSMASYHVAQKLLSTCDSPFSVLSAAYAVAALLCLGAACVLGVPGAPGATGVSGAHGVVGADAGGFFGNALARMFSLKNWPVLLLACAVVGIEVGILYAYRCGASMGTLPLLTNAGLLLVSVPAGVLLFREHVTWSMVVGVVLVLCGFWLMTRQA